MSGEEPVQASDFIEFFRPVQLSYQLADSILPKKEKDSLLISYKIFTQFVPDSVLSKIYGKVTKLKIYALGRAVEPEAGTYLFVKTVTSDKKAVLILAFDKKHQFLAAMTALRLDASTATLQSVTMDRKYTITKTILRKNANGSMNEGKDVYVLNAAAKNFMLIMTDALEEKATELINQGILIESMPPEYYYTQLGGLKIEMLAEAAKDAKTRAEQIANSTGSRIGSVRTARMGVLQITPAGSNDVSDSGMNDTTSIDKDITAVVNIGFAVD